MKIIKTKKQLLLRGKKFRSNLLTCIAIFINITILIKRLLRRFAPRNDGHFAPRKVVCALAGIFFVSCAMASPSTNLSALLTSFNTYSADFNQVTLDGNNQITQTNKGRVMIKHPGKVRWESDSPTKQVLIANGKTLWIYDVDLQQATKQPISTKFTVSPASLLSGSLTQLDSMFTIHQKEDEFLLKAKSKNPSFKLITLTFQNKKMVQMLMVNNLDQKTTFHFTNIKINDQLSNDFFVFTPGKDVDVINNMGN